MWRRDDDGKLRPSAEVVDDAISLAANISAREVCLLFDLVTLCLALHNECTSGTAPLRDPSHRMRTIIAPRKLYDLRSSAQ